MESVRERLGAVIDRWNLLRHPFYEAWSKGELPALKLRQYAGEYAPFIGSIGALWDGCGEPTIAAEERDHYKLWKDFARSLNVDAVQTETPSTTELLRTVNQSLDTLPTALGCLYAFEAQQPHTTRSKLSGLQSYYRELGAELTYFTIHQDDFTEPELLLAKISELDNASVDRCIAACEATCKGLWDTLSNIHAA